MLSSKVEAQMATRIFIVEDDKDLAAALAAVLEDWDFEVGVCRDFRNVLDELVRFRPDLCLLDLRLPAFDGYFWCRKIRDTSQVPIMILSARKEAMNQVRALELGADDFIEKPFDTEVLLAKIRALLRRSYRYIDEADRLQYNEAVLDTKGATVNHDGQSLDLSLNELKILTALFQEQGNYVSRDDLCDLLWGDSAFVDDNTLSVNLSRLRKKLSEIGLDDFIQSRKGLGYRLNGEGR